MVPIVPPCPACEPWWIKALYIAGTAGLAFFAGRSTDRFKAKDRRRIVARALIAESLRMSDKLGGGPEGRLGAAIRIADESPSTHPRMEALVKEASEFDPGIGIRWVAIEEPLERLANARSRLVKFIGAEHMQRFIEELARNPRVVYDKYIEQLLQSRIEEQAGAEARLNDVRLQLWKYAPLTPRERVQAWRSRRQLNRERRKRIKDLSRGSEKPTA